MKLTVTYLYSIEKISFISDYLSHNNKVYYAIIPDKNEVVIAYFKINNMQKLHN